MKSVVRILLLVPAFALGACAANTYCEGQQTYQKAKTVPPLQGVEGLKLPQSASALKIPPPPANTVPYGERVKDADGDDMVACLDKPPAMPPPVEPKPEELKPQEPKPEEVKPAAPKPEGQKPG
jgi:hypothetical protein